MAYLLDTNVFIQAKNLHYGFDFCPAFWEWIDVVHKADRVSASSGWLMNSLVVMTNCQIGPRQEDLISSSDQTRQPSLVSKR